jgi:ABC-type Zn2+ transport system substrate-binding protein/surface adhesin
MLVTFIRSEIERGQRINQVEHPRKLSNLLYASAPDYDGVNPKMEIFTNFDSRTENNNLTTTKMSHHHHDHSHGGRDHEHNHGAHDHSDDIEPALQSLLYKQIEIDKIITLNETQTNAGANIVKKTWAQRLNPTPLLVSDADEQLLMTVPYGTSGI